MIVYGIMDTVFEIDSGLELEDIMYEEYYASLLFVLKIINPLIDGPDDINVGVYSKFLVGTN